MKRRDVFIQILHEVSGRPKAFIETILDSFLAAIPSKNNFDEKISDAEYEDMLNGLRKEKEGILAWLIRGNLSWILNNSDPAGSA